MTVTPSGGEERYIDDVVFADDPFVTDAYRRRAPGRGGPGIVVPARGDDGVWRATRHILLGRD
jgi:hypothetical protein